MPKTHCPECDAIIVVHQPRDGNRFRCSGCDVELEIVNVDPFEAFYPFVEEWDENWDPEWDDDYDESDA